eukprot:434861-Hanusia_phi.AAC.5
MLAPAPLLPLSKNASSPRIESPTPACRTEKTVPVAPRAVTMPLMSLHDDFAGVEGGSLRLGEQLREDGGLGVGDALVVQDEAEGAELLALTPRGEETALRLPSRRLEDHLLLVLQLLENLLGDPQVRRGHDNHVDLVPLVPLVAALPLPRQQRRHAAPQARRAPLHPRRRSHRLLDRDRHGPDQRPRPVLPAESRSARERAESLFPAEAVRLRARGDLLEHVGVLQDQAVALGAEASDVMDGDPEVALEGGDGGKDDPLEEDEELALHPPAPLHQRRLAREDHSLRDRQLVPLNHARHKPRALVRLPGLRVALHVVRLRRLVEQDGNVARLARQVLGESLKEAQQVSWAQVHLTAGKVQVSSQVEAAQPRLLAPHDASHPRHGLPLSQQTLAHVEQRAGSDLAHVHGVVALIHPQRTPVVRSHVLDLQLDPSLLDPQQLSSLHEAAEG